MLDVLCKRIKPNPPLLAFTPHTPPSPTTAHTAQSPHTLSPPVLPEPPTARSLNEAHDMELVDVCEGNIFIAGKVRYTMHDDSGRQVTRIAYIAPFYL